MALPLRGKIYLRFTAEQIELRKYKGQIWMADRTETDTAIEVAIIESVNRVHTFFKPGDKALVHYLVFIDQRSSLTSTGKGKSVADPRRLVEKCSNGDEIYWAYDGTDGNLPDVYARLKPTREPDEDDYERYPLPICFDEHEERGELHSRRNIIAEQHRLWENGELWDVEMMPEHIRVTPPKEPEPYFNGILWIPATEVKHNSEEDKYQIRVILNIHPETAKEYGVKVGDRVCFENLIYEVRTPRESFYIVRAPYMVYKINE